MNSQQRNNLKNRIRGMDNEQLDQYIDDVIEDLSFVQLCHVIRYISAKMSDESKTGFNDSDVANGLMD